MPKGSGALVLTTEFQSVCISNSGSDDDVENAPDVRLTTPVFPQSVCNLPNQPVERAAKTNGSSSGNASCVDHILHLPTAFESCC